VWSNNSSRYILSGSHIREGKVEAIWCNGYHKVPLTRHLLHIAIQQCIAHSKYVLRMDRMWNIITSTVSCDVVGLKKGWWFWALVVDFFSGKRIIV
jgi:hypothetical protein